ncbi:MAG: hypothetical protein AAF221_14570 [Pseudomonadota bacterium]
MKQKDTQRTVFGLDAPGPKLTKSGVWLIVRLAVLPLMAALVVLDLIGFAIARFVFDTCYGALCLFT